MLRVRTESGSWQFYKDTTPPTMEAITEPEGLYYNTAPLLSNLGFDDTIALDDGWYQMDSYSGNWTDLFTNVAGTSWSANWTIPDPVFGPLDEDSHIIYFKASDDIGNVEGEAGEWHWQFHKDTIPPTDPTSVNSTSHTLSVWSTDNTVEVTWTAASDNTSGLDGYSILWDTSANTTPNQIKDIEEVATSTNSTALADGNSHYFHISSVDNAGNWQSTVHLGPFFIDATPPTMEAIAEPEGLYYNTAPLLSNLGFDDTIALDDGWYQMDSSSGNWTDLFTNVAGTSWSANWTIPDPVFGPLDEDSHIIYFKASDDIGNVEGEAGEWHWQFFKDITPPTNPTSVNSTSHTPSVWSTDNTVEVTWTGASDNASGLDGYSILWDTSANTTPNKVKDIEEGAVSANSSALADGDSHYFHISSVDKAGNWQSTVHLGPFFIDSTPPTMEAIAEPEGLYYNTAPLLSNLGFDDTIALDDGWYQMDSYSGNWTVLFTNDEDTSWSANWTIPDFTGLNEGSHTIYFKASDDIGNVEGEAGEWSWQFYKDTISPAAVTDLTTSNPARTLLVLTWTAPGDNVSTGTASTYDIRYSTANITDANWDSAIKCTGEPAPSAANSTETFTITGLSDNTTYWIALKTSDKVPNLSTLSNIATGTTQNRPPVLSGGGVSPTSGYTSVSFTYSVTYTDVENDAPGSITVSIDGGTSVNMTVRSGQDSDYSNGEIYEYTTTGSALGTGSHNFQFSASDGMDDATGDTDSHSGPSVSRRSSGGGGSGGGGGGGGQEGITSVLGSINRNTGKFLEDVTARSIDKKVELTIPKDTIGKNRSGGLLTVIKIREVEEPPAPPADSSVIGLTYDLGPDGATFDPPITLTFTCDPDEIKEGVNEENLVIATWDEEAGEWVVLEGCTVDPVTHTITAPISHFTAFTALALPRPAAFSTTDLVISPSRVNTGKTVTISILVTNTGDLTGNYVVILKIDGVDIATEDVTLSGGDSQTVTFTTVKNLAGTYTVEINGLSGTFAVKRPPAPPAPAPPVTAAAPAPASFTVSNLSVTASEVEPSEQVTISAVVANTGGSEGSYTVILKINSVEEASKEVTLGPDKSETVTFTISRDTEASYTVNIDGEVGRFTVIAPPELELPTEPTQPLNWTLMWGIVGGVLVLGLILWLAVFRRGVWRHKNKEGR